MAKRPLISLDGFAVAFAASGVLLAICIFGQGTDTAPHLLGEPGRGLAETAMDALGISLYALLLGWGALTIHSVLWRRWHRLARRAAGWAILIFACAIAADSWKAADAPLIQGGGTVGAWLSDFLSDFLILGWQWPLITIACLIGTMLATDYVVRPVWRINRRMMRLARKTLQAIVALFHTDSEAPAQPKNRAVAPSRPAIDDGIPIVRLAAPPAPEEDESIDNAPVANDAHAPLRIVRPAQVPDAELFEDYELPTIELLENSPPFAFDEHDQHLRERATLLEKTFKDFDLKVRVVGINTGPVITQYEIALQTGLRVNKVTCLADDLALNLRVPSVRIVAPIPGKNTVGVEIPNEKRAIVRLKEVLVASGKKASKLHIPLFLGKDTEGRPLAYDLADMPHLLIAGRTGTGKSVCLNAMILSMLMTRRPDELKMILIDPKRTELIEYSRLPHLMHPVVTDAKKAEAILAWAVDKMEERYDLLSRARVRNIAAYNELSGAEIYRRLQPASDEERSKIPLHMPYVVMIIDELGDLMMQLKREIEGHIIRLAQKSRAAGIHLIVATQKPTVDVITGLIKSNLPARICFQVSSRSDSRVVLDEMGADRLLGKGDMLFLQPGTGVMIRAQGAFASDSEITAVVEHLDCDPSFAPELLNLKVTSEEETDGGQDSPRARDALYDRAVSIVVREGRGSVSLLQRSLGIGYGRAARLIDFMAEDGIVGSYNGSNAREVLRTPDQLLEPRQIAAV